MENTITKPIGIPLGVACVLSATILLYVGISLMTGKVTYGAKS